MDYLDPKKKRAHKIRLMVGYALFAVAIGMATLLLVFVANGFDVDRSTGNVIQNGLVFVDSEPNGAEVYLNGVKQRGNTDVRLVIPGSLEYNIEIKKNGYRDWARKLQLEGGTLRRLTYARLIPEDLNSTPSATLRAQPISASQSIDKRWLALSFEATPLTMTIIDTQQSVITPTTLVIPSSVISSTEPGTIEVIEWANGDKQFLASYTTAQTVEYILVDRENPNNSTNLSILVGSLDYEISLRDRKSDQFFAYNTKTKKLHTASTANGVAPLAFVERTIEEYVVFGSDWVLYMTDSGEDGLSQARFKRGDIDIEIKNLKTNNTYFLELAKLGNAPIMAISSPVEDRAVVYNDPQNYLKENPEARIPVATTVLRVVEIQDLIISSDSSVVIAYGSENFASHEFESDRSYNFKIGIEIDAGQKPRWLDGQHLSFSSGGKQQFIDFDGSNHYELVNSVPALGSFYSSSIDLMYSFNPSIAATEQAAETPSRLVITNLLTVEDR